MGVRLIMLGAPGAGKGTQAALLSERLGIPTISTGSILRQAIKDGTDVGLQVKALIEAGHFAPDDLIVEIVNQRVSQPDCENGFILDGMPRTLAQAHALDKAGIIIDRVVDIEISDEEIMDRMTGRRVCQQCGETYHIQAKPPIKPGICDGCGGELVMRRDDAPETVKERLAVYHAQTEPLKDFYAQRGILCAVASRPGIAEMTAAVMEALNL
ncbi:MAG: adenylate kinase [Oscillospiraceae bacterium]|nr:adenylate kinase [Oscillospiraceae bacterium]